MSESQRLSKQCAAILARLERGRVSNRELASVALKYTSRVSDLRARGHNVQVVARDHESGLTWYALVPLAPPTQLDLLGAA